MKSMTQLWIRALCALCSLSALACTVPVKSEADAPRRESLDAYVLPDAKIAVHVHFGDLRRTTLGDYVDGVLAGALGANEKDPRCKNWWRSADELLVTGGDKGMLLVARMAEPEVLVACHDRAGKSEHVAEVHRGLVFSGPRALVAAAASAPPVRIGPADAIWRLGGTNGSLLRMFGDGTLGRDGKAPIVGGFSLVIDAAGEDAHATMSIEALSTAEADLAAMQLRSLRDAALASRVAQSPVLKMLLDRLEVTRHTGGRVVLEADLDHENMGAELAAGAEWFGRASLIMERLTQVDIAKRVLRQLADRVVAYAEAHRRGNRALLPDAAPATPKLLADGSAAAGDWSHPTWRALDVKMNGELRHSYSIRVAPDRRRVVLVAEADLDGNGKRSTLELEVRLRPDGQVAVGDFSERDPLE